MTDRREFAKSMGRTILLIIFGFGAVWGFRQKKMTAKTVSECDESSGCRGCKKFAGCEKVKIKDLKETGEQRMEDD